jgi:hypothetical protein
VALVRGADRGDFAGVRASGEPIEQLGADCAAALAAQIVLVVRARLTRDHQHHPRAPRLRRAEPCHQPVVRGGEAEPVEIDFGIGRDQPAGEALVPRAVEGAVVERAILPLWGRETGHGPVEGCRRPR